MPIYRQTYCHYDGEYYPHSIAWTVIAWKNIELIWRNKWFKFFRFPVLGVFLLYTVWIYFATNIDLLSMLEINISQFSDRFAVDDDFYFSFILSQSYISMFITLGICPLLISNDLKHKAIGLYLSKSLSRFDYLFGKGMSLFFYLFIPLLLMPFLLVLLYANFADNITLLFDVQLLMKIFLYGSLVAVTMVMMNLAVSSMSHSSATVNVAQIFIYFLLPPFVLFIGNILNDYTFFSSGNSIFYFIGNYEWWSLLSPVDVWRQLGSVLFNQTPLPYKNIHWSIYVLDLVFICVLCAWFLHIRIKPVEVVK